MIKLVKLSLIALIFLLAGCASTVKSSGNESKIDIPALDTKKIVMAVRGNDQTSKSGDWQELREEWRTRMAKVATTAGLEVKFQNGDIASNFDTGTLIDIQINDYRYVKAISRALIGVATGNAWLDVDVGFRDLKTGNLIGTRKYETKSSAWEGVFSAMTEKQIDSICNQIVREIVKLPLGSKDTMATTNTMPPVNQSVDLSPRPATISNSNNSLENVPNPESAKVEAFTANSPNQPQNPPTQIRETEASFTTESSYKNVTPSETIKVEFKLGSSSYTVEKMAKQRGCESKEGAGLVTDSGPVEVYRLTCRDGSVYLAKCELRQCAPMQSY